MMAFKALAGHREKMSHDGWIPEYMQKTSFATSRSQQLLLLSSSHSLLIATLPTLWPLPALPWFGPILVQGRLTPTRSSECYLLLTALSLFYWAGRSIRRGNKPVGVTIYVGA